MVTPIGAKEQYTLVSVGASYYKLKQED